MGRNLNVTQAAVLLTSGPRWPGRDAGEAAEGWMVSLGFPDWSRMRAVSLVKAGTALRWM